MVNKMKKILLPMSAALVLTAGTTFAQESGFQGGEINLEYNSLDNENLDSPISMWSANFGVAYNLTSQFGLQVGAGYNGIETEFEDGDTIGYSVDMTDLNAHAYYNAGADSKVGVFAARYSVSDVSIEVNDVLEEVEDISTDLMIYGVEGMYESGSIKVEARFGVADIQNSEILGPIADEVDISFYELDAEYAVSSQFNLIGGINGTNASMSGDEITLNTYSVGVEYQAMENLSLTAVVDAGSLSVSTETDSIDLLGYSVGAEYVVSGGAFGSNDITLFANIGTTNISGFGIDEDATNLKIGANIAFGGAGSSDLFSRISLF